MKALFGIVLSAAVPLAIFAQAPAPKLGFEVASIRSSSSQADQGQGKVSVGLQLDGSQVHITSLLFRDYVAMAYRVKQYQVTGPDWISSERFDISAKLPAGSNSDQIPEMLQALLADRFQMKMHRDKKEMPVYAVTVGKPPLKLTPTPPDAETEPAKGVTTITGTGSAQGVSVDLGKGSYYTFANSKFDIKKVDMDRAVTILERFADRPILNLTELKGNYDILFNVTDEDYQMMLIRAGANSGMVLPPQVLRLLDNGSASPLFDALQQVGLKMEARKAPLDLLVVDQALKTPTDN